MGRLPSFTAIPEDKEAEVGDALGILGAESITPAEKRQL